MQSLILRSRALLLAVAGAGLGIPPCPAAAAESAAVEQPRAVQTQSELNAVRLEAHFNSGATFVRDSILDAYLKSVVDRLIFADANADAIPIRIHALRTPLPYVIGLENGAVYVSTGLLARLRNEAQLAGLLAMEIAPIARRDSANSQEATRQRIVRRAVPNILLVAITAGIAAIPLTKADSAAQLTLDARLRLESDKLALLWLHRAGYDVAETTRALERLRDTLAAEGRSDSTELANTGTLNARLAALQQAMSAFASNPAPAPNTSSAQSPTNPLAPFARRFALEIVRDSGNGADTAAPIKLLDRLDAEDGATGETAYLRAEIARRAVMDATSASVAIRAFEACIAFPDAPAAAFRELAFLQRRQGDNAAARRNFEQYLSRSPDAVDAPIVRSYLERL